MASSSPKSKQNKRNTNPGRTGELTSNRTVLLVLGLLVAVFFVFSYLDRANELIAVRSDIVALQDDLAQAKQRNAELEAALGEVAEPAYIGETARSELGLIQPGDDPFVILGQELQTVESQSVESQAIGQAVVQPKQDAVGVNIFDARWWRSLFGL